MLPVSDKFLAEIRRSHKIISYVDVYGPNGDYFRLNATDGSVNVDRTAATRRRCTVTCVDRDGTATPTGPDSVLTPFGTILKLYRGVVFSDGSGEEIIPLGVFHLAKASVSDQVGGSPDISLEAYDFSRTISRAKFTDVYTVAQGTNLVQAIKDIVTRSFPDMTFDSITTTMTAPAAIVYDANTDPWDACNTLATSVGCEVFFDATGRCVIAPPADIDNLAAPDFTFIEGPGCTMLDLAVDYTDDPGYNGVVLTGASAGDDSAPVRSIVWDSEPTSPTYHLGPYGEVPEFVTDQNITTQEAADAAAAALLATLLGFSSQLSLTIGVNPALDVNDVVKVKRARSGIDALYAVDAVSIPLHASGTSALTVRNKRTV
jgi:hypothetical protein